jgi:uncharacterized membrane protein
MSYEFLTLIHIVSVIGLLGFGGGSAFYKFFADMSKDIVIIVHTNKIVEKLDWFITTPVVFLQPITGILLIYKLGYTFDIFWIQGSIILYAVSISLWIVAVMYQIKMRKLSQELQQNKKPINNIYIGYFKVWIILGIISASSMLIIFYMMIFKPILD